MVAHDRCDYPLNPCVVWLLFAAVLGEQTEQRLLLPQAAL